MKLFVQKSFWGQIWIQIFGAKDKIFLKVCPYRRVYNGVYLRLVACSFFVYSFLSEYKFCICIEICFIGSKSVGLNSF